MGVARTGRLVGALILALVASVAGCSGDEASPEAQVRALLADAEAAAEAKDLAALKELVSESYADPSGNDKAEIGRLLTYNFFRNQTVHLLTRVGPVELPAPQRARATVLMAMAGRPIPDAAALVGLRADLYRFDFELAAEDGDWRVRSADWRRADAADFL